MDNTFNLSISDYSLLQSYRKINPISGNKKEHEASLHSFLSCIDETPDYYDPYSDLNLFLAQKIKKEAPLYSCEKKWTVKLQEELLQKIKPEFEMKFPKYRLGVPALKKTWEKLQYYYLQLEDQNEAYNEEGQFNIGCMIKENLRLSPLKLGYTIDPYHAASQIAHKVCDCLAIMEAKRPQLDYFTHLILGLQKHLSNKERDSFKTPFEDSDVIDRLIVKSILETTTKEPHIEQKELQQKVKDNIRSLCDLPSFSSLDKIRCNVSALLAEKIYSFSAAPRYLTAEEKAAISNFIKRHSALYKNATAGTCLSDIVRRISALYGLAGRLPKDLQESTLLQAIDALYPSMRADRPDIGQAAYAFISAELALMRNEEFCHSIDYVRKTVSQAYRETKYLPRLEGQELELIEIITWKMLSETEGFLEKLPFRLGKKIEDEIGLLLIDSPSLNFSDLVQEIVHVFKSTKELTETKGWEEIDQKIEIWCNQGDMLCKSILFDKDNPLVTLIRSKYDQHQNRQVSHCEIISEVCQEYLKERPELTAYSEQLSMRVWVLYKLLWYTELSSSEESSFDRYLKWHAGFLLQKKDLSEDFVLSQLESICKKNIPLIPFSKEDCKGLLFSSKVENYA